MAEGSISVTVSTAEVAKEISRLSRDIDGLRDGLRNDNRVLQQEINTGFTAAVGQMQQGLAATVLQLQQVQTAIDAVENQVQRGIEADAQTKIFEQFAAIAGENDVTQTASRRLEERYNKSIVDTQRVIRRYDALNDTVRQSYQTDIRRLGKYIFELMETHFQKTVENRVSKQHTSFLSSVQESIEKIRQERENQLSQALQGASGKLAAFLKKREDFEISVDSITIPDLPLSGEVALPMMIMKNKTVDKAEIMTGYDVVTSSSHGIHDPGRKINYQLKENDLLRDLKSDFGDTDRLMKWRKMTDAEIEMMDRNLQALIQQNYITQEYYTYLIHALRTEPPMIPESVRKT